MSTLHGRRLEGKVAIVTGGAGVIGREQSVALAREGADVVVNDLGVTWDRRRGDSGAVDRVVEEITSLGGRAVANRDSVGTRAGAERIVDAAIDAFGGLDIIVNQAGIVGVRGAVWEVPEDEWDEVIAANLSG